MMDFQNQVLFWKVFDPYIDLKREKHGFEEIYLQMSNRMMKIIIQVKKMENSGRKTHFMSNFMLDQVGVSKP